MPAVLDAYSSRRVSVDLYSAGEGVFISYAQLYHAFDFIAYTIAQPMGTDRGNRY